MEFLGLGPLQITFMICFTGVVYRVINGMIGKKRSEFSPPLLVTTFMTGVITSIGLVAPVIQVIPSDAAPLVILAAIAGQIATVMGIDTIVRKGQKIAIKIKEKEK